MENLELEAGLAALKQKDYPAAIARLKTVCDLELHQPTVLKAQMNLVMAYQANGQLQEAMALCQILTQSENEKVRKWAEGIRDRLAQRYPRGSAASNPAIDSSPTTLATPPDAGSNVFASLDNPDRKKETLRVPPKTGKTPKTSYPKGTKTNNPTGFVPFESSPQKPTDPGASSPKTPKTPKTGKSPKAAKNPTGFVPFESSPQQRKIEDETKNRGNKSGTPDARGQKSSRAASGGLGRGVPPLPAAPVPKTTAPKIPAPKIPAPKIPAPKIPQDNPEAALGKEKILPDRGGSRVWRQAGRARSWQPMKGVKLGRLWWAQAGTAIALFYLVRALLEFALLKINELLYNLPYIWPVQAFYRPQTWTLYSLVLLVVLFGASPWLMDAILRTYYGLDSFDVKALADRSPEAARLVRRFCLQRSLPELTLGILPTDAPMALSYGGMPRFARIVASRGLLEQLDDDEIAAIYAGELGHIINWDFGLMSVALLLVQIPYLIYWQAAEVGSKWVQVGTWQGRLMTAGAAIFSTIAYGFYWLLRWPALWLSRLRTYYSDRVAASLTGNPNGLIRALLKIAIGIAADIRENGSTNRLLESLDMGLPIGHGQGTSLGGIPNWTPWEEVLAWDCRNPYRRWMAINNSHPPTGDRLYLLCVYAKFWKLVPELDLARGEQSSSGEAKQSNPSDRLGFAFQRLWLQGAPFFGLPMGLAIGYAIWLVGGIAGALGFWQLEWLWGDRWILMGCLPIGVSLGIIVRSDRFFPDIAPASVQSNPALPDLLANSSTLPVDSQPVSLSGKLLGRPGISNLLAQDLILDFPTGLVKLHCFSPLGLLGYFSLGQSPLDRLIGQSVAATGWFRRGATPWIDVETLAANGGKLVVKSDHRLWSTILAALAAIWGAYSISRGGMLY